MPFIFFAETHTGKYLCHLFFLLRIASCQCMKNRGKSRKERVLDKFVAYVKANPDVSHEEAAKAMNRAPRTIYTWCKKLGIGLTTSRDQLTPALKTGKEEEIPSELDKIAGNADREMKHLVLNCM